MARYYATIHAKGQMQDRLGIRGKGDVLQYNCDKWLNTFIPMSEPIGDLDDGKIGFRYKQHLIVVDPKTNAAVTVSYFNNSMRKDFLDIEGAVRSKIDRVLRQYRKQERELLIEKYEAEIRKLKVFNPNTQASIDEKITEISRELTMVNHRIYDVEQQAKKYGVEV